MMLRGVKCNICGELGNHYASTCPLRNTVGVPLGLRQPQSAQPPPQSEAEEVLEPPPLSRDELISLIRKRPEVPQFLRCLACMTLPRDAIWCRCCDAFVCRECLGPTGGDGDWACPHCACDAVDNFHVIEAMRACMQAWFESAAEMLDPYSVSSDDERVESTKKRHRV